MLRLGAVALALWSSVLACGDDDDDDVVGGRDSGPSTDASDRNEAGAPEDGGPDAGGAEGPVRAFPGAEGWGAGSPGGRAGRIHVVTTLDWDGPGSFAEALFATEPRIVVFRVSGVIEVPVEVPPLEAQHSFITVAGQTSPGGVTFLGGGAPLNSYHTDFHDGVFRFLRFRGRTSYDNVALNEAHHLVFDHCDFSGGEDETLDITFSHDVTVQWSTITNSGPAGQRYGFLLAYPPTTNVSFHHNLTAHHVNRCGPHMHWGDEGTGAEGARIDIRNNVLYDCAFEKLFDVVDPAAGDLFLNFVGNTGKPGPNTPLTDSVAMIGVGAAFTYEADNVYAPDHPVFTIWSTPVLAAEPNEAPEVTTLAAATAYDRVLAEAGAWPRDPMNERTIQEVIDGTGALGQVDDALLDSGPEPPPDGDLDGMPDDWETDRGLDPGSDDSAGDDDQDDYTNVEEYLAERAASLVGGG